MKHKFFLLYTWFVRVVTFFFPDAPIFMRFRGWLYSFAMKQCGKNFQVSSTTILLGVERLSAGNDVYIAHNVVVNARAEIMLESQVMVGFNSVLVASNHTFCRGTFRFSQSTGEPIVVGMGSWIAANVTVVSGGVIPESTLIAANSVVVGKLDKPGIYGGIPAKYIGSLETSKLFMGAGND